MKYGLDTDHAGSIYDFTTHVREIGVVNSRVFYRPLRMLVVSECSFLKSIQSLYRQIYSETCLRRSPLAPDQLAVMQRWPAYRDCIED